MEIFFAVPKKEKKFSKETQVKQTFGEKILTLRNLWKKNDQKTQTFKRFLVFQLKMSNKQKNLYYIKDLKFKMLPFQMTFYGKAIANLYKFYQSILEIVKVT